MSNDTVYLKARKPNGALFSISGHKSKFRKIEFTDGSLLDFSQSDFPSADNKNKLREGAFSSSSRDTVSLTTPSVQYQKDSIFLANKATDEQLLGGMNAFPSQSTTQFKTDSAGDMSWVPDSSESKRSHEMTTEDVAGDTEGMISKETKPSNAMVKIEYKAANKKKGRRLALSLGVLSVVSFAGSVGTYYRYHRDHPNEVKTFEDLNNSMVKGSNAESLLSQNQSQHDKAQMNLTMSRILLGAGVAFLAAGIVIYF
jgi:hypothetical protein